MYERPVVNCENVGGVRSDMRISSDHWTRRCSLRVSGKALEKASVLTRIVR